MLWHIHFNEHVVSTSNGIFNQKQKSHKFQSEIDHIVKWVKGKKPLKFYCLHYAAVKSYCAARPDLECVSPDFSRWAIWSDNVHWLFNNYGSCVQNIVKVIMLNKSVLNIRTFLSPLHILMYWWYCSTSQYLFPYGWEILSLASIPHQMSGTNQTNRTRGVNIPGWN